VSGCTRRKCHGHGSGGMVTKCDECKKKPWKPFCGPNGVTYDNLCTAEYCARFDALEVTPSPRCVQCFVAICSGQVCLGAVSLFAYVLKHRRGKFCKYVKSISLVQL